MLHLPDSQAIVVQDSDPDDKPADVTLAGRIGHVLNRHYPGYDWYVDIPPNQNVVIIRNLTCNPRGQWGFMIYKDRLDAAPERQIVMGGGESLERYRMRRGPLRPEDLEGRNMHLERPDS